MNALKASLTTTDFAPLARKQYVGQRLGNYRLVKFLGQGGFATIYLGEHRYLGTRAAVKVLRTQLTSDEVEKFCDEARTAARLVHPHIVRVLEFGLEDRTPFLVMDYAPYGTLHERHASGVPLGLETTIHYVKQIASALQFIHNCGLIHQDIKPENLLLGSGNRVLLSDFGITVRTDDALGQKAHYGTVPYMAPEQIQGKPCLASDQYALGVVVYEWLCGEVPFQGSTLAISAQHLFNAPPSLREKVPTIPAAVEAVVMRALAKDPRQRFHSVQEFARALEQAYKQSLMPRRPPVHSEPIQYSQLKLASSPQALILGSKGSKRPKVKRRNIWQEIAALFAIDMLIGAVVGITLFMLGSDVQKIGFLIPLSLVSLPLLGAYAMKNRPALLLAATILAISAVLGVGFHSQVLFITVYVALMFLSLATTFSASLHKF